MSDLSFGLTVTALAIGGVLVVAARYHRYTYRRMAKGDPRRERWLYWCSWLIGGALWAAAMIPYGWQPMLAVSFASLFIAVLHGPFPWNRRRWTP
jgi:hypothetical protein